MSRERRQLFLVEEPMAEPGRYGCPMLALAHRMSPVAPSEPMWRCSLGWALHGEADVACCQETEAVADCWKIHPERKPVVTLLLPEAEVKKSSAD